MRTSPRGVYVAADTANSPPTCSLPHDKPQKHGCGRIASSSGLSWMNPGILGPGAVEEMTAATACRTCGTEPREGARFCDACGSVIAPATEHAEYKQVTVLFADVVQSMDIAAAVGAERLREIMTELVERSAAVMKRYGGTVDKFTGDGIMAVFGAPVALEDHASRACMAALGIQAETHRLAAEVDHRDHITLRLRIGLNSGQVIAGEIGSGPFGYTAVGEQVGMAQRMESVAPPGGIMLSASTARLVDGAAAQAEPEFVSVKGAAEPVRARRLLGMVEPHRDRRRGKSNLVGRRWEMSAVEGLLDRAIDGHGAVVGVVGSPGIGKSRLVHEVSAMAAARGVEVFPRSASRTPVRFPSTPSRGCCARPPASRVLTRGQRALGYGLRLLTPRMRTCCSWMTCWASAILMLFFLGSIRMRVVDG